MRKPLLGLSSLVLGLVLTDCSGHGTSTQTTPPPAGPTAVYAFLQLVDPVQT